VSGLETDLRQMVFSVAVRGTDAPRRDDFEELVNRTLSGLADGGLGSDLVEGALRTTEFRSREIRGGRPFGMRLMRRALRGWLHDRPPLESLAFEAPMAELRRRAVPGYFEDIIRSWLLENPHRSTVTVAPDPDLQNRREEDERRLLDEMQSSLGDAVDDLKASLDRLEQFQETPDRPEDLARIPFLTRGDLPTEVIRIPVDDGRRGGITWYRQDTFANGVAYLEAAFDLSAVDAELQPWLPLFGRALTDVGLPGRGYDDVARELAMKTGGLACSLEASPVHPSAGGGLKRSLFVHLKALSDQWSEAVALTGELMRSADFADIDRIGDLLVELRNDTRSAVVPSGHAFASLRAASRHSSAASWEDLWYGVGQLRFLDAAVSRSGAAQEASRALLAIRDRVFRRNGVHLAVTGDSDRAEAALEDALRLIETLPEAAAGEAEPPELFRHPHRGEGLSTATAVSFSAVSLPNPVLGSPDQAWSELLAHILRTGYLWEQIRMKGGAYGASASVSPLEGTFTFSTYRDPLIAPSLEAFRSALDWAVEELDDATVDLAVIGAVGRELRPMGPGERGAVALKRRMYGITDDLRQSRRDVQLVSGASELRRAAARLRDVWDERSTTVIGASDALDDAAAAVPELSESRIELPS